MQRPVYPPGCDRPLARPLELAQLSQRLAAVSEVDRGRDGLALGRKAVREGPGEHRRGRLLTAATGRHRGGQARKSIDHEPYAHPALFHLDGNREPSTRASTLLESLARISLALV